MKWRQMVRDRVRGCVAGCHWFRRSARAVGSRHGPCASCKCSERGSESVDRVPGAAAFTASDGVHHGQEKLEAKTRHHRPSHYWNLL